MKTRNVTILKENLHWSPVFYVTAISPTQIALVEQNTHYTRALCVASVDYASELTDRAIRLNADSEFCDSTYNENFERLELENRKERKA
jgi:uncharacterized protein YkvS